jgi:hypothetical protein
MSMPSDNVSLKKRAFRIEVEDVAGYYPFEIIISYLLVELKCRTRCLAGFDMLVTPLSGFCIKLPPASKYAAYSWFQQLLVWFFSLFHMFVYVVLG